MKVVDTILRYPGNSIAGRDGICRARVFATADGIGLLLTDLGDLNTGQSVTNAIESACRTALENGLVDASARVVEHYERSSGGVRAEAWTPSRSRQTALRIGQGWTGAKPSSFLGARRRNSIRRRLATLAS